MTTTPPPGASDAVPTVHGWYWRWDGEVWTMLHVWERPGHNYLAVQEDHANGKRHFRMVNKMGGKWFGPIEPPSLTSKAEGGDWPEDFSHENGNYANTCSQCGHVFVGHKRRVVCKSCTTPPAQVAGSGIGEVVAWRARYAGGSGFGSWNNGPCSDEDVTSLKAHGIEEVQRAYSAITAQPAPVVGGLQEVIDGLRKDADLRFSMPTSGCYNSMHKWADQLAALSARPAVEGGDVATTGETNNG